MKNINSVMGFNKYTRLKEAAEILLAEKKAAKLENEKQRAEYERIGQAKQQKESELRNLQGEYGRWLTDM